MADPALETKRIFKTFVGTDRGEILTVDTIEHQGALWLVPYWLEAPDEGWQAPQRIIRLDVLQHQKSAGKNVDYILNGPIPTAVLDGNATPEQLKLFVVIESPAIRIRAGGGYQ